MYKRVTDGFARGGSFQLYMPKEVQVPAIVAMFGAADDNGYVDEEAGYYGEDWYFEHEETGEAAHVYTRFGVLRVGSKTPERAEHFAAWFCAQLGFASLAPKAAGFWISPIGTRVAL